MSVRSFALLLALAWAVATRAEVVDGVVIMPSGYTLPADCVSKGTEYVKPVLGFTASGARAKFMAHVAAAAQRLGANVALVTPHSFSRNGRDDYGSIPSYLCERPERLDPRAAKS
jgi:hypothetical protein